MESGDIVLLLPGFMAYTTLQDTMQRNAAKEASEEAKLKRASSAYRHAGGVKSGLGERSCFLVSVTCSCVHERYRGKGRKYPPPVAPGRLVCTSSALRRHQLPAAPCRAPEKDEYRIAHLQCPSSTPISGRGILAGA